MAQTILIIEDDSAIREAVVDILELEGYQALGAEEGIAGVALAFEKRPDLIICDVTMPYLDGYGVLAELVWKDMPGCPPSRRRVWMNCSIIWLACYLTN